MPPKARKQYLHIRATNEQRRTLKRVAKARGMAMSAVLLEGLDRMDRDPVGLIQRKTFAACDREHAGASCSDPACWITQWAKETGLSV